MLQPTTAPGRADIEGHARRAAARVDGSALAGALRELLDEPSPRGHERALALRLAAWSADRWPAIAWRMDEVGSTGGQLVARVGPDGPPGDDLLLYSHLDTSLTGDLAHDAALTGMDGPTRPSRVDEVAGVAAGFGLGVAKGPAAAALIGFAAAAAELRDVPDHAPLQLLLASAGTHCSPFDDAVPSTSGIRQHLATHGVPGSAVVAKGGPDGVLHEEPGAMFLRIRLGAGLVPVLAQASASPAGGLPIRLGPVLDAVGRWVVEYRGVAPRGQLGAEAGLGSIVAGRPRKPDLLPARADLHLYVALLPGAVPDVLAADLGASVRAALELTDLGDVPVDVEWALEHPAASTDPHAVVVRSALAAWGAEHRVEPPVIRRWSGSTDGVVLRGVGCETARLGPRAAPSASDPRLDEIALPELERFARVYARILVDHALRPRRPSTQNAI